MFKGKNVYFCPDVKKQALIYCQWCGDYKLVKIVWKSFCDIYQNFQVMYLLPQQLDI